MKIILKKYWKYTIIALLSCLIIFYFLVLKHKDDIDPVATSEKLNEGLNEIKERIIEVQNTAIIETSIAKQKLDDVETELKTIATNEDDNERRKRLAELAKRVSN